MKRIFLYLSLVLISNKLFAQTDYNKLFREAISSIETNYAGFTDKTENKKEYYGFFLKKLLSYDLTSSKALEDQIDAYLEFFEDNHLRRNTVDVLTYIEKKTYKTDQFKFKMINENTCYLKIPHFMYKYCVDSLVNRSMDSILIKRNLIIDIRDNSGGGDASFNELLPIIATNDINVRAIEYLATKTNWEFSQKYVNIGAWDEKLAGQFIKAPWIYSNKLISPTYRFENRVNEFPKHVAVLIDGGVGSAAEQFVFCAKQSLKVKIFGENTAGAIDYSNCRPFEVLKDSIYIQAPTTRYKGLPKNAIDKHGIAPDFYLNSESQVEQILKYFKVWE